MFFHAIDETIRRRSSLVSRLTVAFLNTDDTLAMANIHIKHYTQKESPEEKQYRMELLFIRSCEMRYEISFVLRATFVNTSTSIQGSSTLQSANDMQT